MFRIVIILCLWAVTPSSLAQSVPPPPRPSTPTQGPDGRIEIPETGFSMLPPPNWEILRNSHGSTLLFRGPKEGGDIKYQSTVQVMVFQGYRYIDEVTQQEFGKLIVEKFGGASNQVQDYRLRSAEQIKLETGDESILFYTEFTFNSIPIMQMHILVSSATHHFLMTYTDLASSFEEDNSKGLMTAYTSMHSAVLSSHPPSRYNFMILGGASVGALLLIWFGFRFFRNYQMARLGERIEEEENREIQSDQETEYYSRHTPLSEANAIEDDEDDVSPRRKKAKEKPAKKVSMAPPRRTEEVDDEDREQDGRQMTDSHVHSELEPLSDMKSHMASEISHIFPEPMVLTPHNADAERRQLASTVPPIFPPEHQSSFAPPPVVPNWKHGEESTRATQPPLPPPGPSLSKTVPPMVAEATRVTVPPSVPQNLRKTVPPMNPLDLEIPTQHSEVAKLSDILPQDGTEDGKKGKKKGFWSKKKDRDEDESEQMEDDEVAPVSSVWAVEGDNQAPSEDFDVQEPKPKGRSKKPATQVAKEEVAVKEKAKAKDKKKAKKEEQPESIHAEEDAGEADGWNLAEEGQPAKNLDDDEEVS